MKKIFDFVISFLCLILLLPLGVILGFCIICELGLPVFFKQERIGKKGSTFKLFNFRTMRVLKSAQKGSFNAGNSMRVTKVGRILRKTKLNKLPQLINDLKGNMSIVGPRPEVKQWTDIYPENGKLYIRLNQVLQTMFVFILVYGRN